MAFRKRAHAIYRNCFGCKNENLQLNIFDIFLTFAQNIDCVYALEPHWRGGSNEDSQSMFCRKNKKNKYTPLYPNFTILKWGLRVEVNITQTCFRDDGIVY